MAPELNESDSSTPRVVVAEPDEFADSGAREIARALRAAAAGGRQFSLALSGGNTPGPVHERLARATDISWRDASIYFADERAVPPDDPDSNYRLAYETLLARVPIADERIHRMEAERPDRDAAAARYASVLPERLDVLVLGIGADGHTASLFPGARSLAETVHTVLAVDAPAGVTARHRLTVTPPVLRAARSVIMLVSGRSKAEAVRRALAPAGDVTSCPARLARAGTWVLDRSAAALLEVRAR